MKTEIKLAFVRTFVQEMFEGFADCVLVKNSMAAKKIQLTRALIFSSILLANVRIYNNSIIELERDLQDKIIKKFSQIPNKVSLK